MDDKKIDLLKKIKKLAMKGATPGEREAAQKMLDKIISKYDINESQLDDLEVSTHKFYFHGYTQKKLLIQIADKVLNRNSKMYKYTYNASGRKARTIIGIDCTESESIEIKIMFEFYNDLYNRELDLFLKAFIYKHSLYGEYPRDDPEESSDKLSYEDSLRLASMMNGLSNEEYIHRLQLPSGNS